MDPLHMVQLTGSLTALVFEQAVCSLILWGGLWFLIQVAPVLVDFLAPDSDLYRWLQRTAENKISHALMTTALAVAIQLVRLLL